MSKWYAEGYVIDENGNERDFEVTAESSLLISVLSHIAAQYEDCVVIRDFSAV